MCAREDDRVETWEREETGDEGVRAPTLMFRGNETQSRVSPAHVLNQMGRTLFALWIPRAFLTARLWTVSQGV